MVPPLFFLVFCISGKGLDLSRPFLCIPISQAHQSYRFLSSSLLRAESRSAWVLDVNACFISEASDSVREMTNCALVFFLHQCKASRVGGLFSIFHFLFSSNFSFISFVFLGDGWFRRSTGSGELRSPRRIAFPTRDSWHSKKIKKYENFVIPQA